MRWLQKKGMKHPRGKMVEYLQEVDRLVYPQENWKVWKININGDYLGWWSAVYRKIDCTKAEHWKLKKMSCLSCEVEVILRGIGYR